MRRLTSKTITHSSTLFVVASHFKSSLKMNFLAVLVALAAAFASVMAQGYNNNANLGSSSYSAPSVTSPVYHAPAPSPYDAPAPSPYGAPAPRPYAPPAPAPSPYAPPAPAPSPYGAPAPAPSPYGASDRAWY